MSTEKQNTTDKKQLLIIPKLKEGQTFKNYNELCSFFGWNNTRGTYKKAREKELSTLCDWHKEGNKIIIDTVFKEQKQKIVAKGKDGINKEILKTILIHYLSTSETVTLQGAKCYTVTNAEFIRDFGIGNEDYAKYKYNQMSLAEKLAVSPYTVEDIYTSDSSKIITLKNEAIKALEREGYIRSYKCHKVLIDDYDEEGRLVQKEMITHYYEDERRLITAKKYAMKKMKCYTEFEAIKKDQGKYNKLVINYMKNTFGIFISEFKPIDVILPTDQFEEKILEHAEKEKVTRTIGKQFSRNSIERAKGRKEPKEKRILGECKDEKMQKEIEKHNNRTTGKYVPESRKVADKIYNK